MDYFVSFFVLFLTLVLAQLSLQCTCDWRYRKIEAENVPNTLCYPDQKYMVFTMNTKREVPGPNGINDDIVGRIQFDVTVSKVLSTTGEQIFNAGKQVILEAPRASSLCGYINFQPGISYYMSFRGDLKGIVYYNACHYSTRAPAVTEVQLGLMLGELTCPPK